MGPFYRYKRASTSAFSTTSSGRSGDGGAAAGGCGTAGMSGNPRGFAAFFRSLPAPICSRASSTTKTSFRFFARDQGGFYTSHGPEAQEIARRFFSTQTVIRQQAGLPSLSISHKLFASRVLPALLASGVAVEIWESVAGTGGPSGKEEWVVAKRASPGNTRELEELMLSSFSADGSEAKAEATALLGTGVMMAVQAQGGRHGKPLVLGVAVANASFRTLAVGQLEDTGEFKALEALAVQVGAKECLVICQQEDVGAEGDEKKEDYLRKSILDVMTRCGVLCTQLGREAFLLRPKGGVGASASSVFLEEIRMLIHGRPEGPSAAASVTRPWDEYGASLTAMAPMKLALASAHVLLLHLGLLRDEQQEAEEAEACAGPGRGNKERGSGWDVSILSLAHSLQYDAMAARALTVFPEVGRVESVYRGSEGRGE
ncbi:dna mismatch repair protein msh-2 [Nannochloropsis oceanica]